MAKKLRFGVLGCGAIARRGFLPALQMCPDAALVAVASRSREKAESFASAFGCEAIEGYEDLLKRTDIDAVYIALPIGLHAPWSVAAAESGKHVLCEKTLATNLEETEAILAVCKKHRVALLEGFAYQFHPQHQCVKTIVNSGKIGDPILFQACFGFPPIDSEFRYQKKLGGGCLLDAGTYTIHAARLHFGLEPMKVMSVLTNHQEYDVDIHGSVLLDFGKARTAQLAFGFDNAYRNCYSIWGTKGLIYIDSRAFSTPPDFTPIIRIKTKEGIEEEKVPPYNHFLGEIQAFCRGIEDFQTREIWMRDAHRQAAVLAKVKS